MSRKLKWTTEVILLVYSGRKCPLSIESITWLKLLVKNCQRSQCSLQ